MYMCVVFLFKQKTAYEMRISDWSSDVCSSDLILIGAYGADPSVNGKAGASYVIYGKAGGYTDPLDLASLTPTQGFKIGGAAAGDYSGNSVKGDRKSVV